MVHMPSHIDIQTGNWDLAIKSNKLAIEADENYRKKQKEIDFYRMYMGHSRQMLVFSAMMTGQSKLAIQNVREMVQTIPQEWAKANAGIVDGFIGLPFEVLSRFGKWDEILAEPELPKAYPISRALRAYARGVAYAALDKPESARSEQKTFLELKKLVPADAYFWNNLGSDILGVADTFLEGEISFREGKIKVAIEKLREAVKLEDQLHYDEPPDWILPARHALGAVLLKDGQSTEAEKVFREDLARFPRNVWSLHGLARSLHLQKRKSEAQKIDLQLSKASKNADIRFSSSCMCIPGI